VREIRATEPGRHVARLRFEGLTFAHGNWTTGLGTKANWLRARKG